MSTIKTKLFSTLLSFLFIFPVFTSYSQETEDPRVEEVLSLTQFYEFMLNTLGSASTTQRDKDVIITESFTKAFANQKVQVEDDLLDDRKVITNKDIHSYLRDVDFFFRNVRFTFDNIEITQEKKPNDDVFYLVSFEKSIEGTTLEGQPIKKIQKRFLEVNIDEQNSDLKIVSVYTTKVSREQELREWYSTISFGWLNVFDQYVDYDSITAEVLQKMTDIDSINLSENQFLQNIKPLVALKNLQYLNISDTRIEDLSPVRYSTDIKTIVANNTLVQDLSALQYFDNVRQLELSKSQVVDIKPIANLGKLEVLDLSQTSVTDFTPLKEVTSLKTLNLSNTSFFDISLLTNSTKLESLNISQTRVVDLNPISKLKNLQNLDVSETSLLNLQGLEDHPSLETINISQTLVNSLEPIERLPNLKKVEADLSDVRESLAAKFMETHPNVVVVVNSKELRNWWDGLSNNWKTAFGFSSSIPTKEELIKISNTDSLDISTLNLSRLQTPLSKLKKLKYLNVSNHPFTSFDFTNEMANLKVLIAKNTNAKRLVGLSSNTSLTHLDLEGSSVESITALNGLSKLDYVNLSSTNVPEDQIKIFIKSNPNTTIIWRAEDLKSWWEELDDSWKNALNLSNPTNDELHKLTQSTKLEINGIGIKSLAPLKDFHNLQELHMDQVGILNFKGMNVHSELRKLTCINGPLQSIEGLSGLTQLTELNISNTAVEDLKDLTQTSSIKRLNCAGTNIKKLRGVEEIRTIEYLNISNTNVFKLDRLFDLINPKELICYNTRLRKSEAEEFQEKFPDCKVVYY